MKGNWVVLTEVYNQDEACLIHGLLNTAEIPVLLEHETGELFPFTVGPMAVIKITVPAAMLEEARRVLAGELTDPESPADELGRP